MEYTKPEAKDWARQHMKGVCNVLLPTFTSDLKRLNEAAIRHDVRRDIELGFWGTLVVSECGTSIEEYKRFLEIVIDESRGRLRTVVHTSFNTLEEIREVNRFAEAAGADAMLLAYPPLFRPRSQEDIYQFTRTVMDACGLATIIFNVHHWNFDRLHPSDITVDVVNRLADLPNAVAIKCEGGAPSNAGLVQILEACGDRLLISDPREHNSPAWVKWFGMQWMGTSNYEAFGGSVPACFKLMHEGRWDEAMELHWRMQPARLARLADNQSWAGASFIHRFSWKYQGWLNGFNGGPLRLPVMRLRDGATARLYGAFKKAGLVVPDTSGEIEDFFVGRNPA